MPAPVAGVVRRLFKLLSRLRGRRIMHPVGIAYEATLEVAQASQAGAQLLGRRGSHRAVVRLSRATGLPEWLPDVLGVAVRVVDAYGEGAHQDLLLASSGRPPGARHLIVPRMRFSRFFSSLLLHRVGGELVRFGAEVRQDGRFTIDLLIASPGGAWRPVALVRSGERLSDAAAEAIRFNPWNSGGIRPTGPLMGLREPAYVGSQEGRSP